MFADMGLLLLFMNRGFTPQNIPLVILCQLVILLGWFLQKWLRGSSPILHGMCQRQFLNAGLPRWPFDLLPLVEGVNELTLRQFLVLDLQLTP